MTFHKNGVFDIISYHYNAPVLNLSTTGIWNVISKGKVAIRYYDYGVKTVTIDIQSETVFWMGKACYTRFVLK